MIKHRSATPEQLPLPLPSVPEAQSRRATHDEIVLLLAHLLLSATRRAPAGGEYDDEPR